MTVTFIKPRMYYTLPTGQALFSELQRYYGSLSSQPPCEVEFLVAILAVQMKKLGY